MVNMDASDDSVYQGRVQLLDGHIVYSPNCSRDVSIPEPNPEIVKNIFLPSVTARSGYDFSSISLSSYQKPRWWSEAWGWTSFIPCQPKYRGCILRILARLPVQSELYIQRHDEYNCFSLHPLTVKEWSSLEADLFRMAYFLSQLTKSNIVKPVLPWVFGYKKQYRSYKKALNSIQRSRDWFVVWMGIVSFLVAKAECMEAEFAEYPALSIPRWKDFVVSNCCDPTWLDAFSISEVCTFTNGTRAGVFIDPLAKVYGQPSIEKFMQFKIPIWYIWNADLAQNPKAKDLAPPAYQLQNATTTLPLQPSLSSHPSGTIGHTSLPATRPPISWRDFFATRDERNRQLRQNETPQKRQAREQRERNPPINGVKVFTWETNENGHLIRELVDPRDRIDTLALYSSDQIQYDAFANEYDCCEEFGPGDGYNPTDYFESGEEEEPFDNEIPAEQVHEHRADLLQGPRSSLPSAGHIDDGSAWVPSHCRLQPSFADKAEEEILHILRLYFGYTPPLPCPPTDFATSLQEKKNFLKLLGIPYQDFPLEVFSRAKIAAAFGFMRRLCSKGTILEDEWDLSRNHREAIAFKTRVKSIQKAARIVGSTSSAEITHDDIFFLFEFGNHSAKKWKLAVTSAADAITVCRLDSNLDDVNIAIFLLQNGIPFHTFVSPSSHYSLLDKYQIQYPHRPSTHVFDSLDYAVYIDRSVQLLKGHCGRMALMQGGYLWRLAVPIVSFDTVLSGPVAHSASFLTVNTENGERYIDNQLTSQEMDILSGLYVCTTGRANQEAKLSWYPLKATFRNSGHNYGRWTINSENIFNIIRDPMNPATDRGQSVHKQPLAANKWRDAVRGSGDLRRAQARVEEVSSSVINSL